MNLRLVLLSVGALAAAGISIAARENRSSAALEAELMNRSLQFFLEQAHPTTGLVRDKADNFGLTPAENRVASIASTGFGLAVTAHAAAQGHLDHQVALNYCTKTLRFARDHVARKYGWFLHWIDWSTGERVWQSEYSTIDSALFLGGALYAARIFPHTECASIAEQLYLETDFWSAMTEGGTRPDKRLLNMAYVDEMGWTPSEWNMYAEQKLLLILGLGHPRNPLPEEAWLAFSRQTMPLPSGDPVMGLGEALFVHQYSEAFIDFRKFRDRFPDYFANSERVTRYQRHLGKQDARFKSLREGFWGFSAGESPRGYTVASALSYGSTVCIGCVLGSTMFMPDEILSDVSRWLESPYKNVIWGRYGLTDSVDLDQNWTSPMVLGITVGPVYMALANLHDETSFWREFMQIPAVQEGMERASRAHMRLQRERKTSAVSAVW